VSNSTARQRSGGGRIIFYGRIVAGRIFLPRISAAINFSAAAAKFGGVVYIPQV